MPFLYKMKGLCKYSLFFLICFLMSSPSYAQTSEKPVLTAQKKPVKTKHSKVKKADLKIKIQSKPLQPSLDETIRKIDANVSKMTDVFDSALFKRNNNDSSSLMWFHDSDLLESRNKITNTRPPEFEFWWKYRLASSYVSSIYSPRSIAFLDLDAKVLSQWSPSLFGQAEFELRMGAGSGSGDKTKITGKEILILWKAYPWLTLKPGIINQTFLRSPLLMEEDSNKPFPGIVGNINLSKKDKHTFSTNVQLAVPENSVESDKSYILQLFEFSTPLFVTQSTLWHYDPKSYYKISSHLTWFYFHSLNNSNIPENNILYENTMAKNNKDFEYPYYGLYTGIEPTFNIFPKLKLHTKFHYINNLGVFFTNLGLEEFEKYLHQGFLISISAPLDMTENLRITPRIEYFRIQPDATIGYYGSENYGYTNRHGFLGEIITNIYTINMEIGLRFIMSWPVKERGLKQDQYDTLIFVRSNYARI